MNPARWLELTPEEQRIALFLQLDELESLLEKAARHKDRLEIALGAMTVLAIWEGLALITRG